MTDRYTVIHPDTLEAMRRAGHVAKLEARIEKLEDELLHCFHRINALQTALRKIADIEHEDLPKPVGAAEGTLWVILAGCVEVAGKALEGKDE
jgi:hypothetical protein